MGNGSVWFTWHLTTRSKRYPVEKTNTRSWHKWIWIELFPLRSSLEVWLYLTHGRKYTALLSTMACTVARNIPHILQSTSSSWSHKKIAFHTFPWCWVGLHSCQGPVRRHNETNFSPDSKQDVIVYGLHSLSGLIVYIFLFSFRKKYELQGWVPWSGIPLSLTEEELVGGGREGNELVFER